VPGWRVDGYYLGPDLATLRARFEHEPSFAAPRAAGQTLTVDQALDEALVDAPRPSMSVPFTSRDDAVVGRPGSN
jgi:hypothetical protein